MQYPEEGVLYQDADVENWYGWLIQFTDGNRLDLHVGTAERAGKNLELYRVLVDKDGLFVKKEESSDERYWIRRPGESRKIYEGVPSAGGLQPFSGHLR